jgi:hypothetical protein
VDGLVAELEATEDLALAAHVAEEDATPLAGEAERIAQSLEQALFEVLAAWSSSDEHEVVLTPITGGTKGLAAFLNPLLHPPELFYLSLECHFPAGIGQPDPQWPSERAWGASHLPSESKQLLEGKSRIEHVHVFASGRDAYLALEHFMGLVRLRLDGQRLEVLLHPADLSPYANDAKLPTIASVPTTPTLEIDLDAGLARLVGDEESYRFPGRDWARCLPQLVLSATARREGL